MYFDEAKAIFPDFYLSRLPELFFSTNMGLEIEIILRSEGRRGAKLYSAEITRV